MDISDYAYIRELYSSSILNDQWRFKSKQLVLWNMDEFAYYTDKHSYSDELD